MQFHVDHRFERVTLERFIAVYFSEDFNNLVAPVSGLKSRSLVAQSIADDGGRERRVRMHPGVTLPGPIKRYVTEDQIHYDEVATYDPTRHEVRYRIDSKANDRVDISGTIRFVADGDGVRRLIDSTIKINAPFGVGTLVEKFIEGEVKKGYEKIKPFLQRYLDEHPDGPPPGDAGDKECHA